MEITPVTPAKRTRKVRSTKPVEPKVGTPVEPTVEITAKQLRKSPVAKPVSADSTPSRKKQRPAKPIMADLQQQIATAAYYLAEQRQFAPGNDLQDWLAAEQLIRKQQGQS